MPDRLTALIVEDDPSMTDLLAEILGRYPIDVERASDAGQALSAVRRRALSKLSLLVLDIMMPYGNAAGELEGQRDPLQIDTGIKLLRWLRSENEGHVPWVAVVTARAHPAGLHEVEQLLGERGRLYRKPFGTHRFEHETALALGLESQVAPCLRPEVQSAEVIP